MSKKIVIVGAGPTGLGAAYRLQELGDRDWSIYERNSYVGGLSASFRDEQGFTWDIGGHVLYPRYDYVDALTRKLLADDYLPHQRDAWIWALDSWVPYPFQNNIRHLPKEAVLECVLGLIRAQADKQSPADFHEWILSTFGEGIAKYFMVPSNRKSWAYPLGLMGTDWVGGSVSVVDIERVLGNVICERDDRSWGSNSQFRFPLHGGTGGLFSRFTPYIEDHLVLGEEMTEVDTEKKVVRFSSGAEIGYNVLISTVPIVELVSSLRPRKDSLLEAARLLKHNNVYVVGVGIQKPCPSSKSWMYFPEDNCCFYRVTYLSNYSPYTVPDANTHYSLMCETSYSDYRPHDRDQIIEKTIDGLISTGLISEADKDLIVSTYLIDAEYAYPIPTLDRDEALGAIQPYLEGIGIFSRGRSGAWLYETSSMDQSIMQGVDVVDTILAGSSRT